MCAYSKSEDEASEAMKQVEKEAVNGNLNVFEKIKAISKAYMTKRECSVEEAVYLIMPELWLLNTFPRVVFANSHLPEDRYRVCCSEEELQKMCEDSTDIFKGNMLDRYMDRPDLIFAAGKYSILDKFCYAEFLPHYILVPRKTDEENDSQPETLEENHTLCGYPLTIPLIAIKEKIEM